MKFLTKFLSKKLLILAGAGTTVAVVAATAVAYYTMSGSGTGTATAGTGTAIQLSGSAASTLYPGGADSAVAISIHNPGSGSQYVATITGTVATSGSCLGTWFVVDPVNYNAQVAAGATGTISTNMRMTDAAVDQDACQGVPVTINWTSS